MFFSTFLLLFWTVFAWTTRLKRVVPAAAGLGPPAQRPYAKIDRNYDTLDQVQWNSTSIITLDHSDWIEPLLFSIACLYWGKHTSRWRRHFSWLVSSPPTSLSAWISPRATNGQVRSVFIIHNSQMLNHYRLISVLQFAWTTIAYQALCRVHDWL